MKTDAAEILFFLMMGILLLILLSGCTLKGLNTTLFLKEDDKRLYSVYGGECMESGYVVKKELNAENIYSLTSSYSNCSIESIRTLKEYEIKDWGIKSK